MSAIRPAFPELARQVLLFGGQLNKDGVLVIRAERFSSQDKNRSDARARLNAIIARASVPPRIRRKTRVPKAAGKRSGWKVKKRRGEVKKNRGRVSDEN